MARSVSKFRAATIPDPAVSGCIGSLIGITEAGSPLVMLPGFESAVASRTIVTIPAERLQSLSAAPIGVLVIFEDGHVGRPIIAGLLRDSIVADDEERAVAHSSDFGGEKTARVDGRYVVIEAEAELELRCGRGSIKLRRDGHVSIRGVEIVSRSSGRNKVKGATVSIN